MKKRFFFIGVLALYGTVVLVNACKDGGSGGETGGGDSTANYAASPAQFAFANAVNTPPPSYTGPVFELSHDYPQTKPAGNPEELFPWLAMDVSFENKEALFTDGWDGYLSAILEYVREGQDQQLTNDEGWKIDVDGGTRWYHMPWMAYDKANGREFAHGCTNERVASVTDFLNPYGRNNGDGSLPGETVDPNAKFETWAFGIYNEFGGYALSQAWPEDGSPQTQEIDGKLAPAGLPFPNGTVVAKLLFTTASPEDVYYLEGSPEYMVNRHVQEGDTAFVTCERDVQPVYLVQLDVAVVDHRSPTNWVFGTFAYNGTIDAESPWDRLDPVGIQYGMDPETFPAVPQDSSIAAYQSVLNGMNIYQHYGCNNRLAGPVDNELSSCMSCHGGAFAPPPGVKFDFDKNIPPIFGFANLCEVYDKENEAYFSTYAFPDNYPSGKYDDDMNLDFSLQMWVAFQQYAVWKTDGHPDSCMQ